MKPSTKRFTGTLILAAVFNLFTAGLVSAGSEISADKLDAYVNASIAMDLVIQEWGPKIEAATSEEEGHALKVKANTALALAIEGGGGITVDEYTQMMDASRSDPSLKRKLDKAIEDKLGH
ncbi:hypothetical protein MNBD_GAMMA26-1709 [hydrothermal vent metagenome]|uniref:DUF4168 domain-containing protein n=1 Tax=hydrothermal vent metagenome TaxID=652676 RepID=A0A3B1AWE1_9ZZZZ